MTFFLKKRTEDEQQQVDQLMFEGLPSFGERLLAQTKETRILKDLNGESAKVEAAFVREITSQIPSEYIVAPDPSEGIPTPMQRHDRLFASIERAKAANPKFGNLPTTIEELDAEVDRRRRAQLEEAQDVLSQSDGFVPELLGDIWAEATTPEGAVMLGTGLTGAARLGVTMAVEGGLAALDEARTISTQQQVADQLGIDGPNALQQVGIAGLTGAGFAGILAGGGHALSYGINRARTTGLRRPADAPQLEFGEAVDAAEDALARGEDPATSQASNPTRRTLVLDDFDFSPTGNASPQSNRVGYVFGKLIGLGYEPHIAAGLVGNIIQESGAGINTRAVGDGGNAFGMGQWNGPRRRAYLEFARQRGTDPGDIDTQIEFLHHELTTTEASAGAKIRTAPDARTAARIASEAFWRPGIPHLNRRMANAAQIAEQFQNGSVPKWTGQVRVPPDGPTTYTGYSTSRGYTGTGQVTAGRDFRIDVDYEVVDASTLTRASGDLQPRDRGRASSDEQVAEIAASLDPARLMPAPEADRGAPIVGPDGTIESGNGRVMAVQRAYDRHPDRADAYRKEIEAAGYDIPEGIAQPVLVGRRRSELTDAQRQDFVRQANFSATARMSATERAAVDARRLDADTVALFDPAQPLTARGNVPFTQRVLNGLPQSERNALVDASGRLNAEGVTRVRQAMFARAFDAPDILARFAEADAGELRSLMDALEGAAPSWAAMRSAVSEGRLRSEMDVTPFLMEAVRTIADARRIATRENKASAQIVEELLADVDLLDGALPPLTAALVRKLYSDGRALAAPKVTAFLDRFAAEAHKVGKTDAALFDDTVGALDILKSIDKAAFGHLTETGTARIPDTNAARASDMPADAIPQNAFTEGALSPEAQEADDLLAQQISDGLDQSTRSAAFESAARGDSLSDEAHDTIDAWLEDNIRTSANITPEEHKFVDRSYHDNADQSPEIDQLISRGMTPAPVELTVFRGTVASDFGADGSIVSYSFSKKTAATFGSNPGNVTDANIVEVVLPKGTPVFAPRSGISGGEILADAQFAQFEASKKALKNQDVADIMTVRSLIDDVAGDTDLSIPLADGTTFSTRQVLDDLDQDEVLETIIDLCTAKGAA